MYGTDGCAGSVWGVRDEVDGHTRAGVEGAAALGWGHPLACEGDDATMRSVGVLQAGMEPDRTEMRPTLFR